jgi:hypothetical protein
MKILSFLLLVGFSCFLWAAPPQQQGMTPPGLTRANQAIRSGMKLEPPMVTPSRKIDPGKLQREADELKQLAAQVQKQIHAATNGQLPADLPKNLKRIAELTHQLRLQLSH